MFKEMFLNEEKNYDKEMTQWFYENRKGIMESVIDDWSQDWNADVMIRRLNIDTDSFKKEIEEDLFSLFESWADEGMDNDRKMMVSELSEAEDNQFFDSLDVEMPEKYYDEKHVGSLYDKAWNDTDKMIKELFKEMKSDIKKMVDGLDKVMKEMGKKGHDRLQDDEKLAKKLITKYVL